MNHSFHENFDGGEVKPPSERSTGLVFAVVALIVAVLWRDNPTILTLALGVAAILVFCSLLTPSYLKPINILWFKFGLLLHRIVNPIIMFAIFALVFVPAGLIMRLRYDPLRLQRARDASSYWLDVKKDGANLATMENQF